MNVVHLVLQQVLHEFFMIHFSYIQIFPNFSGQGIFERRKKNIVHFSFEIQLITISISHSFKRQQKTFSLRTSFHLICDSIRVLLCRFIFVTHKLMVPLYEAAAQKRCSWKLSIEKRDESLIKETENLSVFIFMILSLGMKRFEVKHPSNYCHKITIIALVSNHYMFSLHIINHLLSQHKICIVTVFFNCWSNMQECWHSCIYKRLFGMLVT